MPPDTEPLHPVIREAEAAMRAVMSATVVTTPQEQRTLALRIDREVVAPLVADPPTDVDVEDVTVAVPGRGDVRCRVYRPRGVRAVGGHLFLFGGAFRQGGIDFPSVDALLRTRAVRARTVVVAPDYALAPEHPYPAALEQVVAVHRWLAAAADELGFPPGSVTVGGMSAGGNLAAALALVNRDGDRLPLRRQVLEVPVTDLTGGHLSVDVAPSLGMPREAVVPMMQELAANYLASASPTAPTASPLLARDLSGLPPADVLVAELDVFRGDGEAYVAELQRHGTPATLHAFAGMTHGSLAFTREVPGAREWEDRVVALLDPDREEDVP
ncbi:alpha/beta hydrolase [Litorihabitans aurantiacus]|uniref:Lipase n=1 Tax=Litorihabitans aurantiacus TaxID=1930061 RepID=A0AA37UX21_9MICO|nr:alpha/beta hydrolase [Litorihabitans aurantiacus]GMA31207.1 lipase [Litorihabitans aurantiacus]